MIALPSDLPLLQVGRYELMAYEPSWVEGCIREAAEAAGHADWWFACDITRSLMLFLRNNYPGTSVTLEYLNVRIRQVLEQVGFNDIGQHVRLTPPQLQISLQDMAVEAEGFELRFFQILEQRLEELLDLGARRITLKHSRRGVKTLRAVKNWSPKCDDLEQNIVHFLRSRLHDRPDCAVDITAA
jgi:hypothetical protein